MNYYESADLKRFAEVGKFRKELMDKFFVYFAMTVLLLESKLAIWEFAAMLSRVRLRKLNLEQCWRKRLLVVKKPERF